MFNFKVVCVIYNFLNLHLCVMNNRNGSIYIQQHSECFDISWGFGDQVRLKLITEREWELVPHVSIGCDRHVII